MRFQYAVRREMYHYLTRPELDNFMALSAQIRDEIKRDGVRLARLRGSRDPANMFITDKYSDNLLVYLVGHFE